MGMIDDDEHKLDDKGDLDLDVILQLEREKEKASILSKDEVRAHNVKH